MPLHTFDIAPLIYLHGYPFMSARGTIDWVDDCLHDVQLTLQGDEQDWLRIQAEGSFGYEQRRLGPILGGSFRSNSPYLFTIALLPELVLTLAMCAESPAGVLKTLFVDATYLPVARDPSSWRLLHVMQAVHLGAKANVRQTAPIRIGASLRWADEPAKRPAATAFEPSLGA